MKQISELSTGYAIRLYELLICWRTTGKTPVIELDDFRKEWGSRFWISAHAWFKKKRVLEPALEQINEHTDITASYEQHKKGRVITGFSFKFKQKKPKQAEIATETPKTATNDLDTIKPLTEPQIAKYSMILCKLGSISDLSNFPTIQPLPIDRKYPKKPWKGRWANSKTNFHSIEKQKQITERKWLNVKSYY